RVEVSLDLYAGVHLALLPNRRRDGPAPRVKFLLRGSALLRAGGSNQKCSDQRSSRTCTTSRPAEQAAARGRQSRRRLCVCCASWSSTMRAIPPAANIGACKRRESPARQIFSPRGTKFATFEMPVLPAVFENFSGERQGRSIDHRVGGGEQDLR